MRVKQEQKELASSRFNTGLTIQRELQKELTEYAKREDKSFSRLVEVLCRWSLEQMRENGISSVELKNWRAVPPAGAGNGYRR